MSTETGLSLSDAFTYGLDIPINELTYIRADNCAVVLTNTTENAVKMFNPIN
ncbi:MAG TPA: hypothetical protein PKD64_12765 [Pirellulaceae bacterium]|nr:hypothetical protein [Pirellulaceae bacterium]HMO93059.1 hypothetical protein [Pirellulaceae bacterium]HMP69689.1 hypothetical protein [Pirellulaceae bacterium]